MDSAKLSCCICLDVLKRPVTIPCGHSYCMNCISYSWDQEDRKGVHSCPQCRKTFKPRPMLVKNILLAALVEDLKKTGLPAAPPGHCYAGPEEVACDVCTGRKMKAVKYCLVCLASFCEKHLQPHYESLTFRKHKLAEVSAKPQQNSSSRHDEVMKALHEKFKTVSAAAERTEKQRELQVRRLKTQQRIQDKEKDVKLLQQKMKAINVSANKAVENSEATSPSSVKNPVKIRPISLLEPSVGTFWCLDKLEEIAAERENNQELQQQPAVKAMDKVFHSSCFCCMSCCRPLQGMQFYNRDGSPQCELCYRKSLAACSRCGERITDRVLKAMGKCFHVHCFCCNTCSCTLEGLPFIAGEDNKPYCVQDYHRRFSPLCEICKEPIVPAPGSEEIVKVVALDKNFHIKCYRCEDCVRPLSSEVDKCPGYPLDDRILCIKCYSKRTKQ
ncbi:hypothetical protein ATANTOWER_023097 [Ataeniobius toweri]|uniref:Zyxin n=1 Tax=Ataeniobius toweri TaxID=208326 RepID=A0ABU7BSS7_9TELE|nr:hypothetical protein [Ataeniobius toweri]